jgi:hypothetical protein
MLLQTALAADLADGLTLKLRCTVKVLSDRPSGSEQTNSIKTDEQLILPLKQQQ